MSHLFFCDEDYKTLGARIKCNPSIKTKQDRDALRQALATNRIDVIGTDHAPHLLSEKAGGALKAVSGMPTLQFSLISIMELVREGALTMEQLVRLNFSRFRAVVSSEPAIRPTSYWSIRTKNGPSLPNASRANAAGVRWKDSVSMPRLRRPSSMDLWSMTTDNSTRKYADRL